MYSPINLNEFFYLNVFILNVFYESNKMKNVTFLLILVKDGFSQYIEMAQTPKTPMKLPIYEPCYFVGSFFFV